LFGDFLRSLLDRHNLQINQLARMTNGKVSAGEISHCINKHKDYQNPTLNRIDIYAKAFGLKVWQFIREYEEFRKARIEAMKDESISPGS
jgi:transcriptional regulator with XRE-family HTH domain